MSPSGKKVSSRRPVATAREVTPETAAAAVRRRCRLRPRLAVVLGSGFHAVANEVEIEAALEYARVPGLCPAGVPGHAGRLLVGRLAGAAVLLFAGRLHFYEGHSLARVTFPVRLAAALGVEQILLTNAAGGIHPRLAPGDFMILRDHINLMGGNPLCGHEAEEPGFVDLNEAYDPVLRRHLRAAAREVGARARSGVYLAVSGPSYETPAEIRAFARLGADAVGMSTVPEVIVARHCGLRVAGLSCITNLAAGRARGGISHEEVLAMGRRAGEQAGRLVAAFARRAAAA